MSAFSPVLVDLMLAERRRRAIRMTLVTLVCVLLLLGVAWFVADNIDRARAANEAIVALGGQPSSGLLGLPVASWISLVVCGLPSALSGLYALGVIWESRKGSLDLHWLEEHREQVVSVAQQRTSYTAKGAEVADTETVLVTLDSGETLALTVASRNADRIATQLRAELGLGAPA